MTAFVIILFILLIAFVLYLNRGTTPPSTPRESLESKVHQTESGKFCVVVDIETTGLIKYKDLRPNKSNLADFPHMLEIGWVVFSGKGERLSDGKYLIKQNQPIPDKATKINGITNEMCSEHGHELTEVLQKFASDIDGCPRIVGHNIMYDKRILEAEYIRAGLPKPFTGMTNYDTMTMGKAYCGMEKWPKLGELYEEMIGEIPAEYKTDRTMGDVAMTSQIFFHLKNRGKIHELRKTASA